MRAAFPEATVYTTLYDPAGTYPEFADASVVTSPLNRIGVLRRNHRLALPFLAWATGRLRVDVDVVLVSTSGWAHGVRSTGRRIVYCHNPARWLYQTDDYLGSDSRRSATRAALAVLRPWLTRWDRRAARSADRYLANSRVVRDRVRAAYGIEATVLPAPHAIGGGAEDEVGALSDWADAGFHLVVSRLLPYKNVDVVVAAFAGMPSRRLVVVGGGPGRAALVRDLPPNVRVVSGVSDAQLRWLYARASALVAPSLEDYGLTPLEAASFGVPTLALEAGGYLDTVAPGVSGLFFAEPTPAAVTAAVEAGERHTWSAEAIRAHAARYSQEEFVAALRRYVEELAEEPMSR
ncbi:MAG: glycosyltransferase [Actinomycetales bacterium]|nr:glycosyltransferase [Candidatus Phosphoribacter baldrii]